MAAEASERIERAVAGDAEATRALLEEHGPRVWAEIRGKIGRDRQRVLDADDVMQVTYMEAILQVGRLTARDDAGFLAWLRRIAENNLRDACRELDRKKRPPASKQITPGTDESAVALLEMFGATSQTPSRVAARGEAAAVLQQMLERLPADYATVVRLYDLEGRAIDEVATQMQRSAGAVHMLRARAHDRLRDQMGGPSRFFSDMG